MTECVDQPRIRVALPRTPEAGAMARALISRHLAAGLSVESLMHAKLVASELVNNAYQHGRGQIGLKAERLSDRLRIEVVDEGQGAKVRINEHPTERGGRGLKLVETVTLQWGAYEGTTHVWADVAV